MLHVVLLVSMAHGTQVPAQPMHSWGTHDSWRSGSSTSRKEACSDVVLRWNEMTLELIQADKTSPPMAARNLAIVHASIYDAINNITRTHATYRVRLDPAPGASLEAAACIAAHRSLISLYPKHVDKLDALLDGCLANAPQAGLRDGVGIGQKVAEEMLAWRKEDMEKPRRVSYKPKSGAGAWEPTMPRYQEALLPGWSKIPCFAMTSSDQFRVASPPDLKSREYDDALKQVRDLGGRTSFKRIQDQTDIAHFWEDGVGTVTPPGHWNRIAQEVSRRRGLTVQENARLFGLLNIALADASILSWDCKYKFDFWRPVQALQGSDWQPLLDTPPFPAYTSGHSTFSGTAAAVLAGFFGTDEVAFESRSERSPSVVRKFSKFSQAAEEAGMSRIYGGIHWSFDNTTGLKTGNDLGKFVMENYMLPRRIPK